MKTITLHQPWATLVILGEKKFETRSWPTQHRGLLGIHAGRNTDWLNLFHREPFLSVFRKHGITHPGQFKLGHMLGEVGLMDCQEMIGVMDHRRNLKRKDGSYPYIDFDRNLNLWRTAENKHELDFGDWQAGRFAWKLEVLKKYDKPFPTRGYQQIWNYEGA